MAAHDPQIKVRLPEDAKAFIEAEARLNASSQSSEVVRCIRERMKLVTLERMRVACGVIDDLITSEENGAAGTAIPPRHDHDTHALRNIDDAGR